MEITLPLPAAPAMLAITGPTDRNLKLIRDALGVSLTARDQSLRISGDSSAVGRAARVVERLTDAADANRPFTKSQLLELLAEADDARSAYPASDPEASAARLAPGDDADVYLENRRIKPMTAGQRDYLDAIHAHDLTVCCGPAGTGKTYLAVAAAVAMLKRGQIRKLVLVRPAVEAGEKLGFLPGSMQDKVNPYLRPLLDALHDMMAFDQIERFMAADLIEIIPLAFMRGRTLNDACIILDEAQNTTKSQMLMFLTRLGHGSKMVVTGDTSQIDLENARDSGLVDAVRRLRHTRGVAMVALGKLDIVRHSLVQRIVEAYADTQTQPAAGHRANAEPKAPAADNDG